MSWGEALRLAEIVRADPSSMLAAAAEGWSHPVTRGELIAMDQFDLTYAATGAKNRKPYPRPFPLRDRTRKGKPLPRSEALERLRRDFGHDIPV